MNFLVHAGAKVFEPGSSGVLHLEDYLLVIVARDYAFGLNLTTDWERSVEISKD
jgi:hypothetical protein